MLRVKCLPFFCNILAPKGAYRVAKQHIAFLIYRKSERIYIA